MEGRSPSTIWISVRQTAAHVHLDSNFARSRLGLIDFLQKTGDSLTGF